MKRHFKIAGALEALEAGQLIVYPTETFYALGVDALDPGALARLFDLKRRDPQKPAALIAADPAMAFALAREVPEQARRLAGKFWPGPLTIVLPARAGLPAQLLGPGDTVGVRVSSHPLARALAVALGRPLTATSANRSGQAAARTTAQARAAFADKVKVYLEGGRLGAAAPSSVVAFEAGGLRVLRAGAVAEGRLAAALEQEHPR